MFDGPKPSLVCRNAGLMAIVGWLIATFAASQVLLNLTVSPAEITGGTASIKLQGTLKPVARDVTLTLTSSLPAVVSAPPSILIKAGSSSFSCVVPTGPVASDTSVKISVRPTLPGTLIREIEPRVATLRVLAPVLYSLNLYPSTPGKLEVYTVGGAPPVSAQWMKPHYGWPPVSTFETISAPAGIAALNGPAPAEGVVVVLTSGDPAATVPSSVTIRASDRFGYFPITTKAVSATTVAEISARIGRTVLSRRLTILAK